MQKRSTLIPSAKRIGVAALMAGLALAPAGCTTGQDNLSREDKVAIGTVAGAVIGGLIGYQVLSSSNDTVRLLAALGGAAAGSYGGKLLSERLTRFDKTAMQETAYKSLTEAPSGETSTWQNGSTGTHGSITPMRTFLDAQGRICREYDAKIAVDGETVQGRETACQTKAGHWVVYSSTS